MIMIYTYDSSSYYDSLWREIEALDIGDMTPYEALRWVGHKADDVSAYFVDVAPRDQHGQVMSVVSLPRLILTKKEKEARKARQCAEQDVRWKEEAAREDVRRRERQGLPECFTCQETDGDITWEVTPNAFAPEGYVTIARRCHVTYWHEEGGYWSARVAGQEATISQEQAQIMHNSMVSRVGGMTSDQLRALIIDQEEEQS